jgi:hypothetical protein
MARSRALGAELAAAALSLGGNFTFRAMGVSMIPALRPGDSITVAPLRREPCRGDILLVRRAGFLMAHRLRAAFAIGGVPHFVTQGDAHDAPDPPVPVVDVLGIVASAARNGRSIWLTRSVLPSRAYHAARALLSPLRRLGKG